MTLGIGIIDGVGVTDADGTDVVAVGGFDGTGVGAKDVVCPGFVFGNGDGNGDGEKVCVGEGMGEAERDDDVTGPEDGWERVAKEQAGKPAMIRMTSRTVPAHFILPIIF